MNVVKNRSTPQGAEFWDHVESIAAQERRQQVNEKAEAARIERLSDAELDAELRSTQEAVIAALQAEVDALKAEVARLSAPLTDAEWRINLWPREGGMRAFVDAYITRRATPPQDVENGGKL